MADNELDYLAVDGVYNSSGDRKPMLNIGTFNINDNIPVNITYDGNKNIGKEIKCFTNYLKEEIKNNPDAFNNVVFVADRGYHSYDFLKFLIDNNMKFIIRVKGTGDNLNPRKKLRKRTKKYKTIKYIRKFIRIVKSNKCINHVVKTGKDKKKIKLKIKSNYILVTNLKDKIKFPNKFIIQKYISRWDIEVFFKHIKNNFKFEHLDEKNILQHKKLYICELIIMYITKMIENEYIKKNNIDVTISDDNTYVSINKRNLINGLFEKILIRIIKGNINNDDIKSCDRYTITQNNKINRSFPRSSKTPFTKWYTKQYSEFTKYAKIIKAFENNTIDKLTKNLRALAKRIKIYIYNG